MSPRDPVSHEMGDLDPRPHIDQRLGRPRGRGIRSILKFIPRALHRRQHIRLTTSSMTSVQSA